VVFVLGTLDGGRHQTEDDTRLRTTPDCGDPCGANDAPITPDVATVHRSCRSYPAGSGRVRRPVTERTRDGSTRASFTPGRADELRHLGRCPTIGGDRHGGEVSTEWSSSSVLVDQRGLGLVVDERPFSTIVEDPFSERRR
jgi:hypothetical protein